MIRAGDPSYNRHGRAAPIPGTPYSNSHTHEDSSEIEHPR